MASFDADLASRVTALVEPELGLLDLDLVDLEFLAGGRRLTLRVSVERLEGETSQERAVPIALVARASRAIGRRLEAEEAEDGEFMPGRYTIEVTSPGVFRRLRTTRHFERHIGEVAKVTATLVEGEKAEVLRGKITRVTQTSVEIEDEARGTIEVELSSVRRANLDPDLDFGRKSGR